MREKIESLIQKLASEFITRESNRTSLITVTHVGFDTKTKCADILVSAFPEKDTRAAVEFLNRNRDLFNLYMKKHSKLGTIPRIRFLADPVIGGTIEEV